MRRRLRLSALAIVLVATAASAHDVGVWRTEIVERAGAVIHVRHSLLASEAPGAFDHDGHLAIDVRADDTSCKAGEVTTAPDGDGLTLDEDFTCTSTATRSLEVIEYFAKEDVASITTLEGETHLEILDVSHRAISVALRRAPPPPRARSFPTKLALGAALALALVGIAIQRILRHRS